MAKSAVAQYDGVDFSPLVAHAKDEVVTHSYVSTHSTRPG
jgi:hypothetical protein